MGHELTHQNRRLSQSKSDWVKQFACDDIDCLIVCRGRFAKK